MAENPSVLFVCVKNGGKSQMAAGLMRQLVGDQVRVESAGTHPGASLNDLSVRTLREVGVDISAEVPKLVTSELVQAADLIVTLGREAHVDPPFAIAYGGLVVSEGPPGTAPTHTRFVARNRIVAGWTEGTVLVEAPSVAGR